jgi:hypothetical protein
MTQLQVRSFQFSVGLPKLGLHAGAGLLVLPDQCFSQFFLVLELLGDCLGLLLLVQQQFDDGLSLLQLGLSLLGLYPCLPGAALYLGLGLFKVPDLNQGQFFFDPQLLGEGLGLLQVGEMLTNLGLGLLFFEPQLLREDPGSLQVGEMLTNLGLGQQFLAERFLEVGLRLFQLRQPLAALFVSLL